MTLKSRIATLEKQPRPADPSKTITDAARMDEIKRLARMIAQEARTQGITAKDDPRLALPLAIAEVIA